MWTTACSKGGPHDCIMECYSSDSILIVITNSDFWLYNLLVPVIPLITLLQQEVVQDHTCMGNVDGSLMIHLPSMFPDLDRQLLQDCPPPFPDSDCVFTTNSNMRDTLVKVLFILREACTLDDRHTVLGNRVSRISDQVLSWSKVAFGLVVDLGLVVHKIIMTSAWELNRKGEILVQIHTQKNMKTM